MLELRDVHSYYGGAHVLRGVTLQVPEGKAVALLGRNGMGKTSTIRSIMGMRPPEVRGGSIRFRGIELLGKTSYEIATLGLGLVPQGRRIFPSLTVVENLTLAARGPAAPANGKAPWTLERVFELYPRLAERKRHRGNQLSGGERQMLANARALMTNPTVLIMDEPSEGLAPLLVQQLGEQLQVLKRANLSILLVEQQLGLALAVADEVYILERGEVVYHAPAAELARDEAAKRRFLGV